MLIKSGRLIDPLTKRDEVVDILIKESKIVKISKNIEQVSEDIGKVINAENLIVSPGLIDSHVHFRDPGYKNKEDLISGARAAAKGGFTSVVNMANTKPVVDNTKTLSYILNKSRKAKIDILQLSALTKDLEGRELVNFEKMIENGASGFSDDGFPIMDTRILLKAFKLSKKYKLPISLHEEDPRLIDHNGLNKYSPGLAETSMVARDIMLAIETGARLNIQHISSYMTVELLKWAKNFSNNIYGEVCPHHFSLTEEAVDKYASNAKMNPPLRTERDRKRIVEGLKEGSIDIIATDHAPHTSLEKDRSIREAPSGIIGLETALALSITNLYYKEGMSLIDIIEKMTINPASLYNLDRGYIKEGSRADLLIFDINNDFKISKFLSKSSNSPFKNMKLRGRVLYTIKDGEIIYKS